MPMTRVLIAERDPAIAALLKAAVCRALECEVTIIGDSAAIVGSLARDVFDLVLLDVGMHSDGLDTLLHVRGHSRNCEVIALTTGVITAPILKTLAGADVYAVITKPFDVTQLDALMTECLRRDRFADPNRPLVFRHPGDAPTHE